MTSGSAMQAGGSMSGMEENDDTEITPGQGSPKCRAASPSGSEDYYRAMNNPCSIPPSVLTGISAVPSSGSGANAPTGNFQQGGPAFLTFPQAPPVSGQGTEPL